MKTKIFQKLNKILSLNIYKYIYYETSLLGSTSWIEITNVLFSNFRHWLTFYTFWAEIELSQSKALLLLYDKAIQSLKAEKNFFVFKYLVQFWPINYSCSSLASLFFYEWLKPAKKPFCNIYQWEAPML